MSLIDDLRKGQQTKQTAQGGSGKVKGPGAFKIPEPGYYGIYVCPPNAATYPWPFTNVLTHGKVGPERKIHPCLSAENTFIWSDAVQAALAKRNKRLEAEGHPDWMVELDADQGCPTCQEIEDPDSSLSEQQRKDMEAKDDYWGCVVPWYYQGLGPTDLIQPYPVAQRAVRGHFCKAQHAEKIQGWMSSNGFDITDPNAAILVRLKRVGKEYTKTRYDFEIDPTTFRKPFVLPKPILAQLKTLEVGGINDPVLAITQRIRSYAEIQGWLGQAPPVQTQGETEEEPEEPHCFKDPAYYDPNDAYCSQECPFFAPCGDAVAAKTASRPSRPAPTPAGKPAATGKAPAPHPAPGKPGNGQQRPAVATSQQEQGDIPGAEEAADFMRAVSTEPDDNGYAEEPDNSDPFGAEFEAAVQEARKGN